jgi:hypothetical protein
MLTPSYLSASASDSPIALAGQTPAPAPARKTWIDPGRIFGATWLVVVPMACVTIYLLSLTDVQPVSDWGRALACANLWVCAIPLWMFLVARRRTIPFAPFASALYVVYFSVPVFNSTPLFYHFRTRAWESVDLAIAIVLVGSLSMVVGLFGTGFLLSRIPKFHREIDLRRSLPTLAIVTVLSLVIRIVTFRANVGPFRSLFYTLSIFGEITTGGLIVAWLRGYLNVGYKALTIALLASVPMIGLAMGFLAAVAAPVAGWIFVYGWERRRIPWAFILAGILLFIPLNGAKQAFRARTWNGDSSLLGPAQILGQTWQFATIAYENATTPEAGTEEAVTADQSRTNCLGMLALVVAETPRAIPYWNGYTYSDLLWKFIPRVVVPDKPSPALGQEFPRRYELLEYHDYETSYNLPQLVEAYINFGPMGILVGMFTIGFIYALIDHLCSSTVAGAIIGCTLFSTLLNMESNFSLVFGGLPFSFVFFGLLMRMFPMEESAAVTAPA